jgi:ubiquinone/menaquinone biosynthesis C-methylase UbiE
MARVDYDEMAASYDRGRALPPEGLDPWCRAVAPHVVGADVMLDLGSGTGMFAAAFAASFGIHVVGVEPSHGMRAEATEKRRHPLASYVAGTGEQIPLERASCDAAWLSNMIHHLSSLDACAGELRRVLRPHGSVLIRSAFGDRLDGIRLFEYFPEARTIAETFPTVPETIQAFDPLGFRVADLTSVAYVAAPSLAVFVERIRHRADSTLAPLPDAAFGAGLARLEAAVAQERRPEPVMAALDLLVLR